jgi:PKD repeat protein
VAAPKSGAGPLDVHFDASASTDPDGDIANYRLQIRREDWSPLAPPAVELVSATPQFDYQFATDGIYKATLTVFDAGGFNNSVHTVMKVGSGTYDEVEDNDTTAQANPLDSGKAESGWLGNVGPGPVFGSAPYYDGDIDFFSIDVPQGDTIVASITNLTDAEELSIGFSDLSGGDDFLGTFSSFAGTQRQATQLSASDTLVFLLVGSSVEARDYRLNWAIGKAPTLEVFPDDTLGEAPFTVNFTTNALDSDGSIERIVWDFIDDDIEQAEGAAVSYTYETTGNHFGKAIAVDDDGMQVMAEFTITVL